MANIFYVVVFGLYIILPVVLISLAIHLKIKGTDFGPYKSRLAFGLIGAVLSIGSLFLHLHIYNHRLGNLAKGIQDVPGIGRLYQEDSTCQSYRGSGILLQEVCIPGTELNRDFVFTAGNASVVVTLVSYAYLGYMLVKLGGRK